MNNRNLIIGIVLVLAVAGGGGWWWQSQSAAAGNTAGLQASGTIEVEEITIASQVGGQIVELAVDRGDEVQAGDVLVRLETDMLDADLARTRATLDALQAARDAAYDAWQAALDLQANPQDIDLKIGEVQAQLDLAQLQVEAARLSGDPAGLKLAETTRDGLQTALDLLVAMRAEPYAIIAQVSQAQMFYQSMESLLQIAEGMRDMLQLQRDKMTLTAPRDGYVIERALSEGEISAPLAPILVLADLQHVTLTVYLSEGIYGQVRLGDSVAVRVDSLPGKAFTGKLTYISPRAEFTPTTVQTQEDRTRLVYAVVISLDNPDLALKPGMIADVEFEQ